MGTKAKIIRTALQLAEQQSVDKISYADVAQAAQVHWTTVRRYLGQKHEMRAYLKEKLTEQGKTTANVDTRTQILQSARRIFARYGFNGATLDQVAADAGLTKGAVYWHYASKYDLYLALFEHNLAQQKQLIPQQAERILNSNDPIAALGSWLSTQFEACLDHPEQALLFFDFLVSSREPTIREKLSNAFEELYEHVTLMFTILQEKGQLNKGVSPKAMAVYIQSVIHGVMVSSVIREEQGDLRPMINDLAVLLWHGFSPSTGNE